MTEPTFTDLTDLARHTGVPKRDLNRIVRQLVKIYDPLRVYLFGSFSWGAPHWNSDLDFCVVVATDEEAKDRIKGQKAFDGFVRRYTDFYLLSKGYFEKMLSNPATMEHKIHQEADVLYTKPGVVFDETQPLCREEHEILDTAYGNLNMAKRALLDPPFPKQSLFHVQQCIEASLRAFRSFHLQSIFKTHELDWLRRVCGKVEPGIKTIKGFTNADAKRITEYYWLRYRKKGIPIPPDRDGIYAEMAIAERVYEFVKHYIATTPPPTEPTIVPDNQNQEP